MKFGIQATHWTHDAENKKLAAPQGEIYNLLGIQGTGPRGTLDHSENWCKESVAYRSH